MALFKLLFSILLFSFVFSAPVEVPTGAPNEGHDPVATISDIDKDVKPSTQSDVLISTPEAPAILPTEHSDVMVENNEGESLKPIDFVPTGVVKEEEAISPSSEFPLIRNSDPTSDPKVTSQTPDSVKEQHTLSDNTNEQGSNPETEPPTTDAKQEDDVKPLPGGNEDAREPMDPSAQQQGDPFVNDMTPIMNPTPFGKDTSSIPEEPDVPPQISGGDLPQGPYEDGLLDQASKPFNEEKVDERSRIYPEPPIEAETTNQEKFVYPEDNAAKQAAPESVQKDFTEIKNEPQDNDRLNSDLPQEPMGSELPQEPMGSELPQDEAKEPIGVAQPEDVGPPFATYDDPTVESEDDSRLPTPDQSDRPDEEDISPDPPFPVNMDGPEEMVGDPVELPMREEANPPAILVRDDLVPPVVPVMQMEQQAPLYINRENVPISEDSVGGEVPEEEVSNPDNTEPGMLSFDNRPEESRPMNIL